MASITKDTIIGDILDLDQTTAPLLPGDGHALPGLPLRPGRDPGAGLRRPRGGPGGAGAEDQRASAEQVIEIAGSLLPHDAPCRAAVGFYGEEV